MRFPIGTLLSFLFATAVCFTFAPQASAIVNVISQKTEFSQCPSSIEATQGMTKKTCSGGRLVCGQSGVGWKCATSPSKPTGATAFDCNACQWVSPTAPPEPAEEIVGTCAESDYTCTGWGTCNQQTSKQTSTCSKKQSSTCNGDSSYIKEQSCSCPQSSYVCETPTCSNYTGTIAVSVEVTCSLIDRPSCRPDDPDTKKETRACSVCTSSDYTCGNWSPACLAEGGNAQTRSCEKKDAANCVGPLSITNSAPVNSIIATSNTCPSCATVYSGCSWDDSACPSGTKRRVCTGTSNACPGSGAIYPSGFDSATVACDSCAIPTKDDNDTTDYTCGEWSPATCALQESGQTPQTRTCTKKSGRKCDGPASVNQNTGAPNTQSRACPVCERDVWELESDWPTNLPICNAQADYDTKTQSRTYKRTSYCDRDPANYPTGATKKTNGSLTYETVQRDGASVVIRTEARACDRVSAPDSSPGAALPDGEDGSTLRFKKPAGESGKWESNLFLRNNGSKIGIGTFGVPESRLHIQGGNSWGSDLSLDARGVQGGRRWVLISTSGTAAEGQGKLLFKDQSIPQNKGVRMVIDTNGNVGIGTSTPNVDLHIRSDSPSAELRLEPASWSAPGHAGFLRFGPARDPNHYIRSGWGTGMLFHDTDKYVFDGGNVGIGTSVPQAKLDVNGGIAVAVKNAITSGGARLELSDALGKTQLSNYQGVAINSSGGKTTIGKGISVEGASAVFDIQQEKQSPDPATVATISTVGAQNVVFFEDKGYTDVRLLLSVGDTLYANSEERTVTGFLSGNDAPRMLRIDRPFTRQFTKQPFAYISSALVRASDINNTTQFVIDSTGKVGIGTPNPNRQLHIKTKSGNAEIDIQSGGNSHWGIYHDEASDDLRFWHLNDRLVLTKEGQLTVATLNATTLTTNTLTVGSQSKIGQYLRASSTTGEAAWADLPTSSQWITNGTAIHYPTGNVGIGIQAPIALLDVQSPALAKHPRVRALVIQTPQPTDPLDGYLSASGGNHKFTPEIQVGDTIRFNNAIRIVTAIVPKPGYPNEELLKTDSPLPFTGELYDVYYRKSTARFGSTVISSDGGTIIPRERMKIEGSILVQNDHSPNLTIDRSRKWEASSGYLQWAGGGTNYWALGLDANKTNNLTLKYRPNSGTGEPSAVALTVLNENGNVGIGTSNPIGKFHVHNKIYAAVGEVSEDNPTIRCSWDKDAKKATPPAVPAREDVGYKCKDLFDPGTTVVDGVTLGSLVGRATLYEVKQTDPFVVANNGNVGIGTSAPNVDLHVQSDSVSAELRLEPSNWSAPGHAGFLRFGPARDPNHYIRSGWGTGMLFHDTDKYVFDGGNVGIGTTDPGSARLAIVGDPAVAGPQPLLKIAASNGGTAALDIGGKDNKYWRIASDQDDGVGNPKYEKGRLRIQPIDTVIRDIDAGITISREWNDNPSVRRYGFVGIGTQDPRSKLDVKDGDINVSYLGSTLALSDEKHRLALATDRIGLDVAELFETEEEVEAGDVLAVGTRERKLRKSSQSYQEDVIGIVSASPALLFEGSDLKLGSKPDRFTSGSKPPVALAGRVPVKVSLENGAIAVGDYLTASSRPGIAMKATQAGVALGVALENYSGNGEGKILVFVNIGEKNVSRRLKQLEKKIDELRGAVRRNK